METTTTETTLERAALLALRGELFRRLRNGNGYTLVSVYGARGFTVAGAALFLANHLASAPSGEVAALSPYAGLDEIDDRPGEARPREALTLELRTVPDGLVVAARKWCGSYELYEARVVELHESHLDGVRLLADVIRAYDACLDALAGPA